MKVIIERMDIGTISGNVHLLDYVKSLENRSNTDRGSVVLSELRALGIEPEIQKWLFPLTANYIVDFSPGSKEKHLLFSAHYDAVDNCPGANDDASGVAVLLGLCQAIRNTQAPVRIVFFDREEAWLRTPFLKLGIIGSLYYALKNNLSDIKSVINLEFCGLGETLVVWPVRDRQLQLPAVKAVKTAAVALNLDMKTSDVPGLFLSSDHRSFRLLGIPDSVTLTLIPSDQVSLLENFVSGLKISRLLTGRRRAMPGVLARLHSPRDDSSTLKEESLRLMLSMLLRIINDNKTAS
jgi:hypothetical protein